MMLSYTRLLSAVANGVVTNVDTSSVNAASIDLHLGDTLWVEDCRRSMPVSLADKQSPCMRKVDLSAGDYTLEPGEFVLAQTVEVFNLTRTIVGEFKLKSSIARSGLGHLLAGHCDPGWHGSVLTLELVNHNRAHPLLLRAGLPIGQIILHEVDAVPDMASYAVRGQYNGDKAAQPSRGVR